MGIKDNAIIILGAVIVALLSIGNHWSYLLKEKNASLDALEHTVSENERKATVLSIKLNDSVQVKQAEIENISMTYKNLQDKYGELLNASSTKPKHVKSLSSLSTVTLGRDTVYCMVDSFGGLRTSFHDDYTDITVEIDTCRKAVIDYSIRDSLTIITYQKSHSLLFGLIKWNEHAGTKVVTHNPKATPVTVMTVNTIKK